MGVKVANNAVSTIVGTISSTDTGIAVAAGTGSLFPTLGATDYFYATLVSTGGTREIVKVTARVDDAMTIVRGQEGTIAQAFPATSRFELRITAASITDMIAEHDQASEITFVPTGGIAATNVQSAIAELDSEAAKSAALAANGGASAVGYTAYTTVQQKLSEFVTPYDYGAVGDGTTDDTTAVQAALSSTAKHVYFPAGLFRVSGTVTSAVDDRTIDGPGKLTATTPVDVGIIVYGDRNCIKMNIDGNDNIARGLRIEGAVMPIIDGGRYTNFYSATSSASAIFLADTQDGAVIRGVTIENVNAPGDGNADGNELARGIGIGLSADPTGNILIDGCYITNIIGDEGDAIAAGSGGGGTYYRLDLTVQRCVIRQFSRRAVKTQGSNVRVIGNSISNDWTLITQVPNRANVIDFVQGGDCIARDNDLYNCNFFNQVAVVAQGTEAWNNFLIAGNTFWGLTSATTDSMVTLTPTGPTNATVTFTNGSANIASTDNIPGVGSAIQFSTSGTLPTNFSTGTTYYIISSVTVGSTTTITVSATSSGVAIVAGSAGSGTHNLLYAAVGIVVRDNVFSGGAGRAISIGKCTTPVVSGNVISVADEGSTRTISFSSGVTKALVAGNIMTAGTRESFIANDGSNSVVSDNHVKTNTPLFSNSSGGGNHLAANNSIDGTAAFYFNVNTTVGNRLGGNYNFASQINTAPGTLFTASASGPTVALSGLEVRVGQIVFDSTPAAGGKIGWTAITSGDAATVTWKQFGVIDA